MAQQFVQAQIKENIKAVIGLYESTGDRGIPLAMIVARKCFPFDDVIMRNPKKYPDLYETSHNDEKFRRKTDKKCMFPTPEMKCMAGWEWLMPAAAIVWIINCAMLRGHSHKQLLM